MCQFLNGAAKAKKTKNAEKYYFEFQEEFWKKPRK